jgi:protoheme IX farnesyltransferase
MMVVITSQGRCSVFAIQFLWQFPHFWAIGFLSFDQYKTAGYKLLPQDGDVIDRRLGMQALIYTCMILPVLFIGLSSQLLSCMVRLE